MTVGFYYPEGSSTLYRVHMTPDEGSVFPYPSTDYVNITCRAVNASFQCVNWHFEPNGTKGGCVTADCSVKQDVVKLVKVVTKGTTTTEYDQGNFYMTFSIDVTNP